MSRLVPAVAVLILVVAPGCGALRGSSPDVKSARLLDGLGTHTRPITTRDPLAQRWFDQGLRLAYGFNHTEAQIAFEECTRVDPTAAMCWWGVAYALGPNYNLPGDPERDREAFAAVEKARAALGGASEVERAYVEAIATRYAPAPPEDRRAKPTGGLSRPVGTSTTRATPRPGRAGTWPASRPASGREGVDPLRARHRERQPLRAAQRVPTSHAGSTIVSRSSERKRRLSRYRHGWKSGRW